MKEKPEIIKNYKKKVKILIEHNNLYFNKDKPKISDGDYDLLKKEIFELEKKFSYLKKLNLTKSIIGSPPTNKFKKIKHLMPMLSLSNAFDASDMQDFLKKINNFLNYKKEKDIELFSEPKIDGISATLIYEKGVLAKGLSRGDGVTGEDILENLKTISKLPKTIKSPDTPDLLEIRCEIYISKNDFQKIKKKFCESKKCCWRIFKTKKS